MTIEEKSVLDVEKTIKNLNDLHNVKNINIKAEFELLKACVLAERGDVYRGMKISDYLLTLKRFGFKEIYSLNFQSKLSNQEETFYVLWHDEFGILLECESFQIKNGCKYMSCGNFYYNIKSLDNDLLKNYMETGMFKNDILIGKHRAYEAVILNIENLRIFGDFIKPWKDSSLIMLVHHGDFYENEHKKEIKEITKNRFKSLPEYVQKMINPS